MILDIHTDGACKGNPGKGGWAYTIRMREDKSKYLEDYGSVPHTTNNIMEMTAVIKALEQVLNIKDHKERVKLITITTDSNYVINGINNWINNWKKNYWKSSTNTPIKNKDLWIKLDTLRMNWEIEWIWVKGHSNHSGNERVDYLASTAAINQ